MPVNEYLKIVKKRFSSGISTEHSYRADLQNLLNNLVSGITVTNEPKRQKCGAPDYIIQKKSIPIGYIEAKDIGIDLDHIEKSEQLKRYLKSLDNLILTDYIEFRFYRYGDKVNSMKLAEIENNKLNFIEDNFDLFITNIKSFCTFVGQTIKSSRRLAEMMAQKAKIMKDVIYKTLTDDDENNSLKDQLKAFRKILINDLREITFADIYAQTIAYGLFAARLHDKTLEDFSRQEAVTLIPKSNPFLRQLFKYVSDPDLDIRLDWIIDDLADIFRYTDLKELLRDFGKSTNQNDPFLHFYETFLSEYDPKLRKKRGVYYTPESVVNFIVRAVDDILINDFNINQGVADTNKINVNIKVQDKKVPREFHKVQILDPATGTGTFLSEVIKHIYYKFKGQQGIWNNYIEEHLIPRLNGFEILMTSYTMCHIKLDMLLHETGYKPLDEKKQSRFRVFLTNSLEDAHPDTGTLFSTWLSNEATEANYIKQDTPVMVVLGNPPYSGESSNKSDWIMNLMEDYKKEPGGKEKLKERNPKWLNDDYVKFIRYGQYFIDKNQEGILAYVNNHSFLDNPTFRGMRWNLLKSFDKIYIIDLHGNSKKKEVCPDGSIDKNVFDIQQGVSINIFIKTGQKKKNQLGQVFHYDLYGKREYKYKFLLNNNLNSIKFKELEFEAPYYYFVYKDFETKNQYDKGFSLNDLFPISGVGLTTAHDEFVINKNSKILLEKFIEFKNSDKIPEQLHKNFNVKTKKGWNILDGWHNLQNEKDLNKFIKKITYRPFDTQFIFYENKLVWRTVKKVMSHFDKPNIGVIFHRREEIVGDFAHIFISKYMTEHGVTSGKTTNTQAPLYIYQNDNLSTLFDDSKERIPNLNQNIISIIENKLKIKLIDEKENSNDFFAPIDLIDYIYAILHSQKYRKKYNEFLKIDFPKIQYPNNISEFWNLIELGKKIRKLHLFESDILNNLITSYPITGNNIITRSLNQKDFEIIDIKNNLGRIWINDTQYFDKIPVIAWEFFIGGYQPAQKYLKDRKNSELSFDEIIHYQKIIVALYETHKTMIEIDKIIKI